MEIFRNVKIIDFYSKYRIVINSITFILLLYFIGKKILFNGKITYFVSLGIRQVERLNILTVNKQLCLALTQYIVGMSDCDEIPRPRQELIVSSLNGDLFFLVHYSKMQFAFHKVRGETQTLFRSQTNV